MLGYEERARALRQWRCAHICVRFCVQTQKALAIARFNLFCSYLQQQKNLKQSKSCIPAYPVLKVFVSIFTIFHNIKNIQSPHKIVLNVFISILSRNTKTKQLKTCKYNFYICCFLKYFLSYNLGLKSEWIFCC